MALALLNHTLFHPRRDARTGPKIEAAMFRSIFATRFASQLGAIWLTRSALARLPSSSIRRLIWFFDAGTDRNQNHEQSKRSKGIFHQIHHTISMTRPAFTGAILIFSIKKTSIVMLVKLLLVAGGGFEPPTSGL